MLKLLFIIISLLLIFYLVFPFISVIASLLVKEKTVAASNKKNDFACIITAYQNIQISLPLVDSLLKQTHANYLVYLVADGCDISGVHFPDEKIILLNPEQKLSSKVKSIMHAVENFRRSHEAVVIFDPDNLAKPDFLSVLNNYLGAGFKAVQGQRTAKNLDTIYACADATGEIYKNYVERLAPYLLGSSPTIAGSGMAVNTLLFKEYLQTEKITNSLKGNHVIVAEDKILQNFLVTNGYQIAFAKEAVLYDEKISTGGAIERQRSRWLYSYFENFSNTISFIRKGLFGLNRNRLLFGLITSAPPLFILLLCSLIMTMVSAFISESFFFCFLIALVIFTGNIFLTLFLSNAPAAIWRSVWSMPLFIFRQFMALLKMQRSKKDFMHTQHGKVVSLDEVEKAH